MTRNIDGARMWAHLFTLALLCLVFINLIIIPAYAQQEGNSANQGMIKNPDEKLPESMVVRSKSAEVIKEEEVREGKRPKYKRIWIRLTTAVQHEEELPLTMPEEINFEGDYEGVTGAVYLKKGNLIRFKPTKEGEGVLLIVNKDKEPLIEYRIEVRKNKLEHLYREVLSLLSDIDGIEVKILGNKVVVDGQVMLVRDLARIQSVIAPYGESVYSLVSVAPHSLKKIAEVIAREINNPDVEVKAFDNAIILEGTVASEDEKQRAETIAKLFLPEIASGKPDDASAKKVKLASMITVKQQPPSPPPPPKMIQVVLHFVELTKDYKKGFLFAFMPELTDGSQIQFQTGTGAQQGSQTTLTGVINNLFPKLNWGKQHGYARVLKSGTLMVQDTKTGTMRSTVRVPDNSIVQPNGAVQNTQRDVGFIFTVSPVIFGERSDLINLTLKVDIASSLGSQGVTNNVVETDVAIRSGQSAAIAGLINNQSGTGYNKKLNPTARPIISLHADREFTRDQSQYVLFVTPVIKASASQGVEKIKKRFSIGE